jgi:hypothetical protein
MNLPHSIQKELQGNPLIHICEVTAECIDIDMLFPSANNSTHSLRFSYSENSAKRFDYCLTENNGSGDSDEWFNFSKTPTDTLENVLVQVMPSISQCIDSVAYNDVKAFISLTYNSMKIPKLENPIENFEFMSATQKANYTRICGVDAVHKIYSSAQKFVSHVYTYLLSNPNTPTEYLLDCLTAGGKRKANDSDRLALVINHPSMSEPVLFDIVSLLIDKRDFFTLVAETLCEIISSKHCINNTLDKIFELSKSATTAGDSAKIFPILLLNRSLSTESLNYIIYRTKLQNPKLEKPLRAHPNLSAEQLVKVNVRFPNVVVDELSQKSQREICINYLNSLNQKEVFEVFKQVI